MAQKLTQNEFDAKVKAMRETNERMKILHEIKQERELYSTNTIKRKVAISNIALLASVISIILYTIVSLIIQASTGIEVSSTLTTLWYSFWTVEITALTGIKITKVIKGE